MSQTSETQRRRRTRLGVERLSDRIVPAVRTFAGGTSALWADPANWVGGTLPAPGDSVLVPATALRSDLTVDGAYGVAGFEVQKTPFTVRVEQPFASSGLVFGDGDITWVMDRDVTFSGTVSFKGSDRYQYGPAAAVAVAVHTSGDFFAESTTFWGVDLDNSGTVGFGYAGEAAGSGTLTLDATYGPSADLINTGSVRVFPSGTGSIMSAVGATSYFDVAGGSVVIEDSMVAAQLVVIGPVTTLDSASSVTVGTGGAITYLSSSPASFAGANLTLKKGAGWYGALSLTGGVVDAVSDGVTTVTIGGDMTASGTTFTTSGPNPNRVTVTSGAAPFGATNDWVFTNCAFQVNVYTSGAGDSSISLWSADSVTLAGTTAVTLTRVSGTGSPAAGTWFRWLEGTHSFSGSDPSTYTYSGTGLQHRKTTNLTGGAFLELNFEGGGPGNEEEESDTAG